ncbi:hypothetical protein BDY24DRAFT_352931, partial [Mrakia frigida]|uniref:uncharacterized protein n=1 Tax=Mrakia frigida TaxID=29902 RepID=UPI003FCBF40E
MPPKKEKVLTKVQQKAAEKARKKAAQEKKVTKKETKQAKGKGKGKADEEDLEAILESFQRDWETQHKVTEEISTGPPSRRANATLVACPTGNYLWCIGGEYFDGDKAAFYNDVYRYNPDKDEWRRFVSPNCPGPRSAHACVTSPAGGGKIYIFGGEYASPKQTTFHHFRDFWEFDVTTHAWERLETKVKPSPRSGCRMAMWKQWIVLFGGFYDLGVRTNYLDDLWVFDTQEYKWKQVEFPLNFQKPSARSGFSLLPCPEGVVLHGGYVKRFEKGKRAKGVALDDTWLLRFVAESPLSTSFDRMDATDMTKWKWEKRRRVGYPPSTRSGCSMTHWPAKGMGVCFGGVFDDDRDEESLDSIFYQDAYAYTLAHPGRWISLNLKKKKKMGGGRRKPKVIQAAPRGEEDDDEEYGSGDEQEQQVEVAAPVYVEEDDPDDPQKTVPLTRYNTMLAILKNTLYVYGGIFESKEREYTLDDFYSLPLDKLDRFVCLKASGLEDEAWLESDEEEGSSSSDDGDEDEGSRRGGDEGAEGGEGEGVEYVAEEEEPEEEEVLGEEGYIIEELEDGQVLVMTPAERDALRLQATTFMGVSKDTTRSLEDTLSTPLPGEKLRDFYERSREYWAQRAHAVTHSDNKGKMLRRDGFSLAEQKYLTYKPILDEIERIQAEAGLEAEDMKKGGVGAAGMGAVGEGSRNRR